MTASVNNPSRTQLERKVAYAISRDGLLDSGERVIVALSGGADSVALLSALSSLGYECVAAHCNFHLRGIESMRDEEHARSVARRLGCRFETIDFDVQAYRSSVTDSVSVEMACRDLRYSWFDKLRRVLNIRRIAVAHNADDNAETMILNLLRGSSLAGVRAMRTLNDRGVIRPVLEVSRAEIEDYLTEAGLDYITDSSNLTDDFTRNRIRHHVLPAMQKAVGDDRNALATLTASLRLLSANHDFYIQAIEEKRQRYALPDGSINLRALAAEEPHSQLLLFEWLSPIGFNRTQTDAMLASAGESGRRFLSTSGTEIILSRGVLSVIRYAECPPSPESVFTMDIISPSDFHPTRDAHTAYFDAEALNRTGRKLAVRYWREGDRLHPFGMKGSRLLSDLFNDAKLSPDKKNSLPILILSSESSDSTPASDETDLILWVPGLRASRHYPVTPETRSILRLTYIKT